MSAIPITVMGTIATEPTARTLPTGRACASFRLAVNHWKVDKSTGEFVDDGTSWFGVDCYGDLASNSSMSLNKGAAVIVTGSLRNREWANAERSGIAPTVVADHIGPDLRFGTAHYRRAKGSDRTENQATKGAGDTAASETGGWGDLDGPALAGDSTAANTTGADAVRYRGNDDGSGADSGGDSTGGSGSIGGNDSTGSNDSTGGSDATNSNDSTGSSDELSTDDAAIAAATAVAGAPF